MTGNFYIDFLFFICYSFLGWVCEMIFCSILAKRLVNRGFLFGPICPIYGFGALLTITILAYFKQDLIALFFVGVIVTSLLEYYTGTLLERLFHTKWWDYSHHRFHIKGRICLTNSLSFGLLAAIVILFIHPFFMRLIYRFDYIFIQATAIISLVLLSVDITLTIQSLLRINQIMVKLKEITIEMHSMVEKRQQQMENQFSDYWGHMKDNFTVDTAELKSRIRKYYYGQSGFVQRSVMRIVNAFPQMRPAKFEAQLHNLRQILEEKYVEHKEQRLAKKKNK